MELRLWIENHEDTGEQTKAVRSPYDGRTVAEVHIAGKDHVERAVAAAKRAFETQRKTSRFERATVLRRAADLLRQQREGFAATITAESAKPLRESRTEVDRGIQTLEFSAEEARRLGGDVVPMDAAPTGQGYFGFTVREPLGVIAAITPFNFPLNLSLHKIGPAIAAGNTVVHKPASTTPVTALKLARLFAEAGLPAGVLNVLVGAGKDIGEGLAQHPDVRMVTFTGSAEVGMGLRAKAGMKRVTLELGNNSAVIVLNDADVANAVSRCVPGAFSHSGQVCISIQRVYVDKRRFVEFVDDFRDTVGMLARGAPEDERTAVSCMIDAREAERVAEWIGEAREMGAELVAGGSREGTRFEPTVLTQVSAEAKLMRQEAFGPVVCINAVEGLDEAIDAVNGTDYGLQTGVFTRDIGSAWKAASELRMGAVLVNETPQFRVDHMPYGGVKMSGAGREGPRYAIEEMTEAKLVVFRQ